MDSIQYSRLLVLCWCDHGLWCHGHSQCHLPILLFHHSSLGTNSSSDFYHQSSPLCSLLLPSLLFLFSLLPPLLFLFSSPFSASTTLPLLLLDEINHDGCHKIHPFNFYPYNSDFQMYFRLNFFLVSKFTIAYYMSIFRHQASGAGWRRTFSVINLND